MRRLRSTAPFVTGTLLETDATTAELVKLMENTFRDVNIALANEFALMAEQLGIDAWEAIRLAGHQPTSLGSGYYRSPHARPLARPYPGNLSKRAIAGSKISSGTTRAGFRERIHV